MMQSITDPTLLLDEAICRSNIQQMAHKAESNNLAFKPHMKTHQSAQIGQWLADEGVTAITVSSVQMARYFAEHGWTDITIAIPCNIRAIPVIDELAANIHLSLLVNNPQTAQQLHDGLTNEVAIYIEIDSGSNRTGLQVENLPAIKELVSIIQNLRHLNWKGFYSHPGHSYDARSKNEIRDVHSSVIEQFQQLRTTFSDAPGPMEICIGDTPCCSVATNFDGIDAISPGNFVFYDLMQAQIGSCQIGNIAVVMACPVLDKYPERNQLAIHGGAIHFSKEAIDTGHSTHFGIIAHRNNDQWAAKDDAPHLVRLSQEHGIIQCSKDTFDQYQVGDLVTVLPVHSCLTAHLMSKYQLLGGEEIYQM
ncbi:MAG: alanine racemase [Fodinibius sp.]|nr:alanine racemase [Fodinibius sp.]